MLEGFNYGGCFSTEEGKAWLKEFLSGRNTKLPEDVCSQMSSVLRELSDHCVLEKSDLELQTADALSSFDAEKCAMNVYRSVSREQVERYLYKVTYSLLISVIDEEAEGRKASEEDKAFIANFYKYAFVGLMLDWIRGDMVLPHQVFRMFLL